MTAVYLEQYFEMQVLIGTVFRNNMCGWLCVDNRLDFLGPCIIVVSNFGVFRWDTGEVERMSPWDLQPVTERGEYRIKP